ncbi:hypothetical protein TNCV_2953651 [Trichonephila clavipes]|nr:hypothetical protein TNCV_2953651 [Trichonephila clavipes]
MATPGSSFTPRPIGHEENVGVGHRPRGNALQYLLEESLEISFSSHSNTTRALRHGACPAGRSNFQLGGQTSCVVNNNAWSTDVLERKVCFAVRYSTVSFELCVPKHLYLDLNCIGLSADPLSAATLLY